MNKEDCVSLEVARILKEKGFNEPCDFFYQSIREDDVEDDTFRVAENAYYINRKEDKIRFAAPLLRQVQNWLMFNHNILVSHISEKPNVSFDYKMYKYCITENISNTECIMRYSDIWFSTKRECLNKGIIEVLKMI